MRIRALRLHTLVVLFTVGLSACTYARIYSTSGSTVALTTLQQGAGEQFTLSKHITFDYTGSVDVQELVRSKYGAGGTAQNVSIKIQGTVGDFFLNLVTLGIANSKHYVVTGDYVRSPSR